MNPAERLDWGEFLARPLFPEPPPDALDDLVHSPVLITGAGGSIGSALALRLARAGHSRLLLLDSSENSLIELQRALVRDRSASLRDGAAVFHLGDVRDRDALAELFSRHCPRIVFHAAAYKHVPFLEEHALAAIANNIFSTEVVAGAAAEHGARVILLSTDKAVEPASVLGATKRVAEEIVLAQGGTALRLGNILGSSGSVTQVFAGQIANRQTITVTDPGARRYFLTQEEAVNLLLWAAVQPGSRALLAPALEKQYRIAELAAFMARSLAPEHQLPIRFTGLRPGDKLEERLWNSSEYAAPLSAGSLLLIHSIDSQPTHLARHLDALRAALRVSNLPAALADLRALVPDYRPSEAALSWAQSDRRQECL